MNGRGDKNQLNPERNMAVKTRLRFYGNGFSSKLKEITRMKNITKDY